MKVYLAIADDPMGTMSSPTYNKGIFLNKRNAVNWLNESKEKDKTGFYYIEQLETLDSNYIPSPDDDEPMFRMFKD